MMKTKLLIVLLTIFSLGLIPQTVFADENNTSGTEENPAGFIYEVVKPENQNSEASYFDLRMKPGQKQTVTIRLKNIGSEDEELSVKLNGAKTSSNGVINYGPNEIENDASLKFDFADIVKGPETVKLPAGKEAELKLDITMPEEAFDGMISGGIQLQSLTDEGQKQGMITNKFAYIIGMVLTENDKAVSSDLKFNKAYAGLSNYRNAIFIDFSNVRPKYMEEMTTDVAILPKDSEEVLYEQKQTGMRMAPNTKIDFPVSLNGEEMEAGDYRAKVTVTSGDEKWEWLEDFTITQKQADEYNEKDVGLVQDRSLDWKIVAMIVAAVMVVALIIFLIIRKVREDKRVKQSSDQAAKDE